MSVPVEAKRYDFFIAHAGADLAVAQELDALLIAVGTTPFLDQRCVELGDDWDIVLPDAQRSSDVTVVLISARTEKAHYQREEIAAAIAFARGQPDSHRVVPVYLDGRPGEVSDVPYGLRLKHGLAIGDGLTLADAADQLVAMRTRLFGDSSVVTGGAAVTRVGAAAATTGAAVVQNLNQRPTEGFFGRADELARLRAGGGQTTLVTQAIQGLGGVGKSQLVLKYAHEVVAEGAAGVVWWVRAETRELAVQDLGDLARRMDPAIPVDAEPERVAQRAREWLAGAARWLVVFDNADDHDAVADLVPTGGSGQLLITSRFPAWSGASPLTLGVFAEEEATDYLLARTERGPEQREVARRLAHDLGGLALALAQASDYMRQTGRGSEEYRRGLAGDPEVLDAAGLETPQDRTIARVWRKSFQAVGERSADAARLMQIISLLAPDRIPLWLLEAGDAGWTPSRIDRAVLELRRFSLVEPGDGTISVHRLVQRVTRAMVHSRDETKTARGSVALQIAHAAKRNFTRSGQPTTGPILAPHARVIIDLWPSAELPTDYLAWLAYALANYFRSSGARHDALVYAKRSVDAYTRIHGRDSRQVLAPMALLGSLQRDLIQHRDATKTYAACLELCNRYYRPSDREFLKAQDNYGTALRVSGSTEAAARQLDGVYLRFCQALGCNDQDTLTAGWNYAFLLSAQGEHERATVLAETLVGCEENRSDDPMLAQRSRVSRAILLANAGRSEEAMTFLRQVLATTPDGSGSAQWLSGVRVYLAYALLDERESGGVREAGGLLEAAGRTASAVEQDAPAFPLRIRTGIARWHLEEGRPSEAARILQDTVAESAKLWGQTHPTTVENRRLLEVARDDVGTIPPIA